MAQFGRFYPCRANFIPMSPATSRAGRTLYRMRAGCGASKHNSTPGAAGVEGTGGTAGPGRHHTAPKAPPVWRAPEGPQGTGGLRDRPLRAAGSRVAISRAAGPDGARNTSGAASNKLNREFRLRRPWAAAGPGRTTSRRTEPHISNQAPPAWRAPEGPEGTGGLRDRPLRAKLACGDLAGGRARRRPEHPWSHKHPGPVTRAGRRPRAHQAARPSRARKAPGPTAQHAAPGTPATPQETQHRGAGPQARAPRRYDSDAAAQKY